MKKEGDSRVDSDMMKISIHQSGQEDISLCQPPLFGWFAIWGRKGWLCGTKLTKGEYFAGSLKSRSRRSRMS